MTISFFSPIYSGLKPHPLEKCAFLRMTTHFFDFGQKAHTIHYSDDRLELAERIGNKPSWIGIALRIAAIFTGIIPLFMLIGSWIYRSVNYFEGLNSLKNLPKELLQQIFREAGPSCLHLGATNQANNDILENDNSLKEYQTILAALKQSYREPQRFKVIALLEISKTLRPMDPQKASEIEQNAIERAKREFDEIKSTMARELSEQNARAIGELLVSWTALELQLEKEVLPFDEIAQMVYKLTQINNTMDKMDFMNGFYEARDEVKLRVANTGLWTGAIGVVLNVSSVNTQALVAKSLELAATNPKEAVRIANCITPEEPEIRAYTLFQVAKFFLERR